MPRDRGQARRRRRPTSGSRCARSMSDDLKQIVEAGYDAIADRYADWSQNEVKGSPAVAYLEKLPGLLTRIASWLLPTGHLLATTSSQDHPDAVYNWLGVPMFFSDLGREANLSLIAEAGFELVEPEVVCQDEGDEGKPCFLWVLA